MCFVPLLSNAKELGHAIVVKNLFTQARWKVGQLWLE